MKRDINATLREQLKNTIKSRRNRGKIDAPTTHMHDHSLSWLDKSTSIIIIIRWRGETSFMDIKKAIHEHSLTQQLLFGSFHFNVCSTFVSNYSTLSCKGSMFSCLRKNNLSHKILYTKTLKASADEKYIHNVNLIYRHKILIFSSHKE